MSANVKAFKAFLQKRQTGLVQRSKAWVKARQHTIGASEIAVLTGASPFDTPASLIRKKLHAPDLSNNVACAWGKLFEPFAREYIEWKHNTQVFGNTITLNLAEGHPLYGKVTCGPDGYFQALDGSIVLLEFKCPFKRKIVVNKIPALYRDQVQTGLALSGELVTKGLFVDCCFRMCSLSQLGMNLAHNTGPHYGAIHKTKTPFPQAWGICILESQRKLIPKQEALLNIGTTTSPAIFTKAMLAISSGELQVRYNRVRVICDCRGTLCLEECKGSVPPGILTSWRFVSCCLLRVEAARHHRDRGAQEPALPAIDRASDHSVPSIHPSIATWNWRKQDKLGTSKSFPTPLRTTSTSSKPFLKG